jgi:hypothetical protein
VCRSTSARRHGVADEDIDHALAHAVAWAELGDDPPRYLLAEPDRAGNLLELVVLVLGGDELVIHAMDFDARPPRSSSETSDDRPARLWTPQER